MITGAEEEGDQRVYHPFAEAFGESKHTEHDVYRDHGEARFEFLDGRKSTTELGYIFLIFGDKI